MEVGINILFVWSISEVDFGIVLILLFRQVERKLIIDLKLVKARTVVRITAVVVLSIAFFAFFPRDAFRRAEAASRLRVTHVRLTVALA